MIAGIEDADLDAVSAQVDTIQENIRSMLKADEETEEEDDGGFDDDVIPPAPKTATVTPISGAAPQATPETETQAADESGENAGADSSTHEKEGDF